MLTLHSPYTPRFIRTTPSSSRRHFRAITKRSFTVFSHLGRSTTRPNYLRKKLLLDDKYQVLSPPPPPPLSSDTDTDTRNLDEGIAGDSVEEVDTTLKEPISKPIGGSVLYDRLESWVDQFERDTEFWGVGFGPIFTVFEGADGGVERVVVNKAEILWRCGEDEGDGDGEGEGEGGDSKHSAEAILKVLEAERLAREMESGKRVIPKNSSLAKFVVRRKESRFLTAVRGFSLSPKFVKEFPKVAVLLFCGIVAVWAWRVLFDFGDKEVELTESEKEMIQRKVKSRKEREVVEKDGVEVIREPLKQPEFPGVKPTLDKHALMSNIARVKPLGGNLALPDSSTSKDAKSMEFDVKIDEIRKMAREARNIESSETGYVKSDDEGTEGDNENHEETRLLNGDRKQSTMDDDENYEETRLLNGDREQSTMDDDENHEEIRLLDGDREQSTLDDDDNDAGFVLDEAIEGNGNENVSSNEESSNAEKSTMEDYTSDGNGRHLIDATSEELLVPRDGSVQEKRRIIRSVKEAREYLSQMGRKQEEKNEYSDEQYDDNKQHELSLEEKDSNNVVSASPVNASEDSGTSQDELVPIRNTDQSQEIALNDGGSSERWNENNVNEHIANKIGVGFRDNFMSARGTKNEAAVGSWSIEELGRNLEASELDWMEDDRLAEIVFQVRENELAGLDPFHKMDAKDKDAFFGGLEKKVEKENAKLSVLHEWLHSNIENLDYGADGISVYDPLDKIVPRWKGPTLSKGPEFLNNYEEQRKAIFAENAEILNNWKSDDQNLLQKSMEFSPNQNIPTSSVVNDPNRKFLKSQKTIIEGSDGSEKLGKKSGKEFWQHTKKWSRGFVESYNAETDPDIRATMKDIGKDLDRWITEKEIQEAADLMDMLPEENKKFVEKKLEKIKREMELYGPQTVASKYREYNDDDQEDYLWWLDLPHILCIEMYTVDESKQRVGFYSVEMATDLELEPKPHHVIGFEDAGDCKNMCYIIQAHMEMLGNGHAFVVSQLPKDAFREAKENGFNVTVIMKGELPLNVDQTLEEVEEQISEIGSKIYHDAIMRDRSLDISSVMKGVFGSGTGDNRAKREQLKKMLKSHKEK